MLGTGVGKDTWMAPIVLSKARGGSIKHTSFERISRRGPPSQLKSAL